MFRLKNLNSHSFLKGKLFTVNEYALQVFPQSETHSHTQTTLDPVPGIWKNSGQHSPSFSSCEHGPTYKVNCTIYHPIVKKQKCFTLLKNVAIKQVTKTCSRNKDNKNTVPASSIYFSTSHVSSFPLPTGLQKENEFTEVCFIEIPG